MSTAAAWILPLTVVHSCQTLQSRRTIHKSTEMFDPEACAWLPVAAEMRQERKYCACAMLEGRLYAVGGMNEHRARMSCVEAYDPREGRWVSVAPLGVPRSSAAVAVLQDRLYAIGGNMGDTMIHATVECYVPAMNAWMPCAPMGCPRSGLCAAAL